MKRHQWLATALAALLLALGTHALNMASDASIARAQAPSIIDFEPDSNGRYPDGSAAVDERLISDTFRASHGVVFALDIDGDGLPEPGEHPRLERVGENPPDAFQNTRSRRKDQAAPGFEERLGRWFLKAPFKVDVRESRTAFLISYDHPVQRAEGDIWDIDGTPDSGYEQWRVEALAADGSVIDSHDSPQGTGLQLDARPWTFTVRSPSAEIHRLRIVFIGRKTKIGFVLDRFTPSLAPTPTPTETPSPTPTPTDTPTATQTPTSTPTVTSSPTPTAVPSKTSTPVPSDTPDLAPIYLPVAMQRHCTPKNVHADVVLVLDISTSMLETGVGRNTKLHAAHGAARRLIEMMDFEPDGRGGHDNVAIVGFNNRAWTEVRLTRTKSRLLSGLDALVLQADEGTRLDLAFFAGAAALEEGGQRQSGNTAAVIVLTDGWPTQVPPSSRDGNPDTTVLDAAAEARRAADHVYTIGLGQPGDTNEALLRAAATHPTHFFANVRPEDLADVYAEIAYTLTCP